MMAPEEFEEKKSVNHTPTIVLTVAAVLLLIVGALSYRDYVRNSLEKEYAEKERMMMARHGYAVQPAPGQQVPSPQQAEVQFQNNYAPAQLDQQGEQMLMQQNRLTPGVNDTMIAQQAANMGVENSLPQPADPEIQSISSSLQQIREQSERTEQQYNNLVSGVDDRVKQAVAGTDQPITSELPDFLKEALADPPGGNPSLQTNIEKMRDKVRAAPSLARVTGYDRNWGIVTFNAGAGQGVKKDQRFAVRRGDIILGWVKVDEVQATTSIAVLVTRNKNIDTAEKPAAGDDLINFELF